jgi:DNA-binding winged helix-turn-helix (wHTH) protein/tetratricopeptide (TPR) repeat protein
MSRNFPKFSEIMSVNGTAKHLFEFDEFRVEVEERRLLRAGRLVTLASRDFDILLALIQNPGQTIDKNDLMEKVWKDTFVEEGNLNRHVSTLRRVLGDDPKSQRFIKTIPKRGYRFTASVSEVVENAETVSLESATRSKILIREETTEGFWTWPKMIFASFVFVVAMLAVGFGVFNPASSGDAVSRRETRGLVPALRSQEHERSSRRLTESQEAFEDYLKGRHLWNQRTTESVRESITYFKRAIEKDPDFALAYVGLADAYLMDDQPKAEPALRKALELDESLGEAHASLGFNRMFWHWDWQGAGDELARSVELSPDYARAHQWFGIYLAIRGRTDEAKSELQRAAELEPLSPNINADLAQIYFFARDTDAGIDHCRKALEIDPSFLFAHQYLFDLYAQKGMYDEAVEEYLISLQEGSPTSTLTVSLDRTYKTSGWRGFLRALLKNKRTQGTAFIKASIHSMLDEKDRAFDELEKAYSDKDFFLVFLQADPKFDNIRDDPRYEDLIRRMNFAS